LSEPLTESWRSWAKALERRKMDLIER